MKFKLDENLPLDLAEVFRVYDCDVDDVAGEDLSGASDDRVVEAAHRAGRVLLTLDKGIASILRYPPGSHSEVVLFRPEMSGRRSVPEFVVGYLPTLLTMKLSGRLTVVSPRGIRIFSK